MFDRRKEILTKIFTKRRLKATQHKVLIREIIVTQDQINDRENRVGEFDSPTYDKNDPAYVKRIMQHIKKMAQFATQIHLTDNFTPAAEKPVSAMKPDCRNNVTRLSFNEYYFYPSKKHGPLTLDTFHALVKKIEKMASHLPENLHLTLSSFPVLDAQKSVANIVMYVQCGTTPSIQTLAKAISSNNEAVYPKTLPTEFCAHPLAPTYLAALGHSKNGNININFSTPILCNTFDAQFLTVIDVCADHELGVAQQALQREITSRMQSASQLIPEQITHIVTSNSTFLYDDKILSATVTHADPRYPTLNSIATNKKWASTSLRIASTNGLGHSEIRCFPQRQVDTLQPKLLSEVQAYNQGLAAKLAEKLSNPVLPVTTAEESPAVLRPRYGINLGALD